MDVPTVRVATVRRSADNPTGTAQPPSEGLDPRFAQYRKTGDRATGTPARRPGAVESQAMNMRAAEAMVSNAPNAMKILPTSEV